MVPSTISRVFASSSSFYLLLSDFSVLFTWLEICSGAFNLSVPKVYFLCFFFCVFFLLLAIASYFYI
jgi:hypothetical protein